MKEVLDIYIDESGNFAPFTKQNPVYSVSFVFVERTKQIDRRSQEFKKNVSELEGGENFIHIGNLVRGKPPYAGISRVDRQKLFYGLFMYAKRTPLSFYSFHVKKSQTDLSVFGLSGKLARGISDMLVAFHDYFAQFRKTIVHYDNGQTELGLVLQTSLIGGIPSEVEFVETHQEDDVLMQVADLICYLETLYYKFDEGQPTNSDLDFFGRTKSDVNRKYLDPLRKKQLK